MTRNGDSELANLDFLRAVAVILVVLDHCATTGAIRGTGFVGLGYFGVMLFFVHTSLVLMLSMERWGLTGIRLFVSFLTRRVFRIYPLSILLVIAAVLLQIPTDASAREVFSFPGWAGLLSNLFLVQNLTQHESTIGVLWSLPFEMQMYIALPLLFLLLRRRDHYTRTCSLTALIWALAAALALVEFGFRWPSLAGNYYALQHFLIIHYFPCFIAGVAAWVGLSRKRQSLAGRWWILLIAFAIAIFKVSDVALRHHVLFGLLPSQLNLNAEQILMESGRDWILCLAVGTAIPLFREVSVSWLNRLTHLIAKYSYGIYICHLPLLWFFCEKVWPANGILGVLATIAATAIVSPVLYHLVEHPAIQVGKRLAQAFAPRATAVMDRSAVPV